MNVRGSIAASERDRVLERMASGTFDCIVIGGGITGAGIAREAALRGLSVALVEQDDYAAGTSSRSSKLIHGGLRYLAMGDIALVRETARERKCVHAMAPHLAEPMFMVVPARSRLNLARFQAGIAIYERLGQVESADLQQHWHDERLRAELPRLKHAEFPRACAYREYLTDDARLVLANLRDAVAAGALVANYVAVTDFTMSDGRVAGVTCRCTRTGREFSVRARSVVNAAGPWAESLTALDPTQRETPHHLHLSKGIHISLPRARLPVDHMMFLTVGDGRNIFVFPRGEVVYVGTTDTDYGKPVVWPEIVLADVEYLLAPLHRYFDVDPIAPEHCIAAWAGLRPLVAQPGKPSSEISRREEIWTSASGLVSIVGGKLTGYRLMAIEAVDEVCRQLGHEVEAESELTPLPGGDFEGTVDALSALLQRDHALPAAACDRLARLYGSEAEAVIALGVELLANDSGVIAGEVAWAVNHEGALTLTDLFYRRTRAALYECERSSLLAPMAQRMRALLGWSEREEAEQIAETAGLMADELAFQRTA